MSFEQAREEVGAVICQFMPDDDECETCGKSQKQLYYIRTCYEVDEGEYHCADCIKEMPGKRDADAAEFVEWYEAQSV